MAFFGVKRKSWALPKILGADFLRIEQKTFYLKRVVGGFQKAERGKNWLSGHTVDKEMSRFCTVIQNRGQ